MFKIEPAFEKGPHGDTLMVHDAGRNVWLQRVSSMPFQGPGLDLHKLVWEGRVIPFETKRDYIDENHFTTMITKFGHSNNLDYEGLVQYKFSDDEERRQSITLAAEALLVFGSFYNGDKKPEGYDTIIFDDKSFTKKDFGMN